MRKNTTLLQLPDHAGLKAWLTHPGSFMRRLKSRGITSARIEVLQQDWQVPQQDERAILNLDFRRLALVREVLIRDDEHLWMYARTVFPQKTLTGEMRQLASLKNKALGSVLFKNPAFKRGDIEILRLNPESKWFNKANHCLPYDADMLWGRRSIFSHHNKSLLLLEVFLPDIEEL